MISKVSLFLFFVVIAGAYAGVTDKLVGATNANIGEFPYQVSLRLNGQHFCGGSLITKKHVLTAAHCVYAVKTAPLSFLKAVVGTNSVSTGGDSYAVKALSYHPKYESSSKPEWMNDIGVITLATEVKLSNRVAIVDLPTEDVKVGDKPVVSGWGTMQGPRTPLSQSLQKLTLNVISHETCKQNMPSFVRVDSTYVCTYVKKGVGACSGDSGGPLVLDGKQIGVVSGGIPCAIGYPDVFTNVYKFMDYIKPIIGK